MITRDKFLPLIYQNFAGEYTGGGMADSGGDTVENFLEYIRVARQRFSNVLPHGRLMVADVERFIVDIEKTRCASFMYGMQGVPTQCYTLLRLFAASRGGSHKVMQLNDFNQLEMFLHQLADREGRITRSSLENYVVIADANHLAASAPNFTPAVDAWMIVQPEAVIEPMPLPRVH
jgi:hypothetical protein